MRVPFACLADAATVGSDGKVNILGEFNCIYTKGVPTIWEEMVYVARLEVASSDDRALRMTVSILDPDMVIIAPQAELTATLGPGLPGIPAYPPIVMKIANAVFPEFGQYTVELRVNGEVCASTYIHILQAPPGGPGA